MFYTPLSLRRGVGGEGLLSRLGFLFFLYKKCTSPMFAEKKRGK